MKITEDIRYVGVNDHDVDLFEGQYAVKNGMAYNSYAIIDQKIAIMFFLGDSSFPVNLSKSVDLRSRRYIQG